MKFCFIVVGFCILPLTFYAQNAITIDSKWLGIDTRIDSIQTDFSNSTDSPADSD